MCGDLNITKIAEQYIHENEKHLCNEVCLNEYYKNQILGLLTGEIEE